MTAAEQEARELEEKAGSLESRRAGRTAETADDLRAAAVRLEEAEKDRAAMEELLHAARDEAAQLPDPEQVPRQPGRGPGILLIVLGVLIAACGVLTLVYPVLPGMPAWAGYLMLAFILLFRVLGSSSVIDAVYTIASYTYGPLLGLFAFGLFTKHMPSDKVVPYIAVASPILCYLIDTLTFHLTGYKFGYELLMLNGAFTFIGLWLTRKGLFK